MSENPKPRDVANESAYHMGDYKQNSIEEQRSRFLEEDIAASLPSSEAKIANAPEHFAANKEDYAQRGVNSSAEAADYWAQFRNEDTLKMEEAAESAEKHKELADLALASAGINYEAHPNEHYTAAVAEAMLDGVHINTGDQQLHAVNVQADLPPHPPANY